MNQAEPGQLRMKPEKRLWLMEAVKVDMVDLAFQTAKYKKFIRNAEKIGGRGPTLKKRNERERVEERRFVDQFCDVIENGDLLEEHEDPEDMEFMPSSWAKHKAPVYDVGIQEKPKKKKGGVPKKGKKLPERSGRGSNPCFAGDDEHQSNTLPTIPRPKPKPSK